MQQYNASTRSQVIALKQRKAVSKISNNISCKGRCNRISQASVVFWIWTAQVVTVTQIRKLFINWLLRRIISSPKVFVSLNEKPDKLR